MGEVFISYAWGGESEAIANALEQTFQEKNIKLVRDKTDLGYKGLIKQFMQQIGQGKCVIAVISDKYLKSQNCMFELLEISRNGEFYDRIFPIVLEDARIYAVLERLQYIKYWEGKIEELEEAMKGVSLANLQGFREEIDLYSEIRSKIAGLVDTLQNMNTLSLEMHKETDFSEVVEAIAKQLQKDKVERERSQQDHPSPSNPPAPKTWQEKLDYLQQQEAITSNPAIKFELHKQIEECQQKIKELGVRLKSALETWRERLEYLQRQLAIASDHAQKFELKKQIEECHKEIKKLKQNRTNRNSLIIFLLFITLLFILALAHILVRPPEIDPSLIKITSGETSIFPEDNFTLEKAFEKFVQGNYQAAKNLFNSYNQDQKPPRPDIKIFQNNAEARERFQNNRQNIWKIAFILKGDNIARSQAHLRGIADAQTQFNSERKYPGKSLIEILLLNDSLPKGSSSKLASKKLLARHSDLLAVVSSYTSTDTEEVLNCYKEKNMPLLAASATATTLKNDYFFRLPPTNRKSAEILSNYRSKPDNSKNNQKGVVIWKQDDKFSRSLKEDFEFYSGKEIFNDKAKINVLNSDFESHLSEVFTEKNVRDNNIKFALLALTYQQSNIAKSINELNTKLPKSSQLILLTGDALYEKGNETINNLVLAVPWFSDTKYLCKINYLYPK